MANIQKPIREKGMIISKTKVAPREAGESKDGSIKWEARDEQFLLEVISCDEEDFSNDTGILNGTRLSYSVTEEIYNKAKFGMWANVKYMLNSYNGELRPKAETCTLIQKNN